MFVVELISLVQSPKEVLMVCRATPRWAISWYLDKAYLEAPRPSWYGESVGHYEGDMPLVIDTLGPERPDDYRLFRTPHTDQLHVRRAEGLVDRR